MPLRTPARAKVALRIAPRWDVALPVLALGAYVLAVALRGGDESTAMFAYADAPAGAYLGVALFTGPMRLQLHSELVAGLIEGAFMHAPAAHVLIQLLGPALAVLAAGLGALAVHRLGGAWWLTATTGVALGPALLWTTLYPTAHVYTLVCLAVLALAVIAIVRGRLLLWQAVLVGLIAGSAAISDQGFIVEGLLPLLLVLGWRGRARDWAAVRTGGVVLACTLASATLAAAWMRASGIHLAIELVPGATTINTPASSVYSIVHAFAAIASGTVYGADPQPPLGLLAALAGMAIPLAAPVALVVNLRRRGHSDARIAYLLFWAAADMLVVAAFVVFGYGGPPQQGHYLVPCLLAATATFPLLVTKRSGVVAAIAAAAVLVQAAGVLTMSVSGYGSTREAARVLAVIRAQGLTRGYAGYWMSHPVTWLSNETVHVYPVQHFYCGHSDICPYEYSSDAWYRPLPGPTFLVVTRDDSCVRAAPASLGVPSRTIRVDDEATVIVYGHDIAAGLGPVPAHICA